MDETAILKRLIQKGNMQMRKILLEEGWHRKDSGVIIARFKDSSPTGREWAALIPDTTMSYRVITVSEPKGIPLTDEILPNISPEAYHNPDIQPVQPDPVIPTANQARVYQRNGSYVNLRSSKASTNKSNVIGRVPHNAVVDVLEWGGVYTRVSYNGQTGYIITSYLRAIQ